MHELSIAQDLVAAALQDMHEHGAEKVFKIQLEVGVMSGVVKECLEFVFPEACKDSPLQGCELEIKMIPLEIQCKSCTKIIICDDINLFCHFCHSSQVEILKGKELLIRSMEVL